MAHGLDDAFEKVRWAEHHFEILRPQIEAFEQRDSHSITVDINADIGEYVFRVRGLEPLDPDWGLVIGDCIHNARTALDYVVVRLWARVTGVDPDQVDAIDFPIYSVRIKDNPTDDDVKKAYTHARKSFKSAASKFSEEPDFSGYLTVIEQLQPFNFNNPSIWGLKKPGVPRYAVLPGALDRLSRLDNVDKHRVPHAAWAAINVLLNDAPDITSFAPAEFKLHEMTLNFEPLEDGAEVSRVTFTTPLPSQWKPTEMDMKRCFPLQVAFGDPSPFHRVLDVLPLCLWAVRSVLTIFSPVFADGSPPLPVTAIREPGA